MILYEDQTGKLHAWTGTRCVDFAWNADKSACDPAQTHRFAREAMAAKERVDTVPYPNCQYPKVSTPEESQVQQIECCLQQPDTPLLDKLVALLIEKGVLKPEELDKVGDAYCDRVKAAADLAQLKAQL